MIALLDECVKKYDFRLSLLYFSGSCNLLIRNYMIPHKNAESKVGCLAQQNWIEGYKYVCEEFLEQLEIIPDITPANALNKPEVQTRYEGAKIILYTIQNV